METNNTGMRWRWQQAAAAMWTTCLERVNSSARVWSGASRETPRCWFAAGKEERQLVGVLLCARRTGAVTCGAHLYPTLSVLLGFENKNRHFYVCNVWVGEFKRHFRVSYIYLSLLAPKDTRFQPVVGGLTYYVSNISLWVVVLPDIIAWYVVLCPKRVDARGIFFLNGCAGITHSFEFSQDHR